MCMYLHIFCRWYEIVATSAQLVDAYFTLNNIMFKHTLKIINIIEGSNTNIIKDTANKYIHINTLTHAHEYHQHDARDHPK